MWFHTITRPAGRLMFTIVAFVLYVGGIALSVQVPECRLCFQIPANVILMVWFFDMLWRQRRAMTQEEAGSTLFRALTRTTRRFALTVGVFATHAVCVLIAAVQPSWQPFLVPLGAVPAGVWLLVAAVMYFRAGDPGTDHTP